MDKLKEKLKKSLNLSGSSSGSSSIFSSKPAAFAGTGRKLGTAEVKVKALATSMDFHHRSKFSF
jgi:hypothetical protein